MNRMEMCGNISCVVQIIILCSRNTGGGGGVAPTHAVQRVKNRLLKYMDGKLQNHANIRRPEINFVKNLKSLSFLDCMGTSHARNNSLVVAKINSDGKCCSEQ